MARPIGTLGVIDTLTIGNRVFTDIDNLFILGILVSFGHYGTLIDMSTVSSGGYTPSGGKTFKMSMISIRTTSSPGGPNLVPYGYGDTDVGASGGTPPTNAKYPGGALGTGEVSVSQTAGGTDYFPVKLTVPNGKYPFVYMDASSGAATFQVFGYEV